MRKNGAGKVVVVGGGPAGLAAAIFAGRAGAEVVLAERNPRCGAKLLATGGGHCNAGNLRPADEWPALFGRRGRFLVPALEFLPRGALEEWFARLGEPLAAPDGFHLFPVSRSARRVRDALCAEAEALGVKFAQGARCGRVLVEDGAAVGVEWTEGGATVAEKGNAVLLATGGASYPSTGSDWSGCRIAERIGHKVAAPVQGLVGLRTDALDAGLAGLVLPRARVTFKAKGSGSETGVGELLATHTGISGPAVLDCSASVCKAIAERGEAATVRIRWVDEMDAAAWRNLLERGRGERGSARLDSLVRDHVPQRLAKWLCGKAGLDPECPLAELKSAGRDALPALLADFPVTVVSGEGWDRAMITRGGVDARQINPATLESRLVRNLFLAGEMIDLDGPCGGYNLHWAFAGGALSGRSAALKTCC